MNNIILHLTKDYIKQNGITTFIENLINNDSLNTHYIISNYIEESYLEKKNNYFSQKINFSILSFIRNIRLLINICNEMNIDIIHSHHRYLDLLSYAVSKFTRTKTITTVNSKVYGRKLISYKSDKIVAVGKSIKRHLIDYFKIDEKILSVITNFIDTNSIKITRDGNELRNEMQIPDNKYIVGFVGRFDIQEKGIDVLLRASIGIIDKNNNVVFVFIGDGVDKEYLIDISNNFKENLRIVETKNDVFNYMQIFDLFVLPSRIDPYPLVMLEAAYMKIPFIGSNVDGIDEFIEEGVNGLLFERENNLQLAQKILFLKNNKEVAQRLADENYKKVTSSFLAQHKVPEYQREYLSLMKNKSHD